MKTTNETEWLDTLQGLKHGDFSRLEPHCTPDDTVEGARCRIIEWYEQGAFAHGPQALAEAFTCACFLGRTGNAEYLRDSGVDPWMGTGTDLSAFHWAQIFKLYFRCNMWAKKVCNGRANLQSRIYGRGVANNLNDFFPNIYVGQ